MRVCGGCQPPPKVVVRVEEPLKPPIAPVEVIPKELVGVPVRAMPILTPVSLLEEGITTCNYDPHEHEYCTENTNDVKRTIKGHVLKPRQVTVSRIVMKTVRRTVTQTVLKRKPTNTYNIVKVEKEITERQTMSKKPSSEF